MSKTFDGSMMPWHNARPLSQRYKICLWIDAKRGHHCVKGPDHRGAHRLNPLFEGDDAWRICSICYLLTRTKPKSK